MKESCKALLCLIILVVMAPSYAIGQINGPINPSALVNVNYTYNDGNVYIFPGWTITNGTVISSSSSGSNYSVTVQWTSSGPGVLTLKSKINVIIGNKAVMVKPVRFTLGGGGYYCSGQNGVSITLSGSETGTSYQLYRDGVPSRFPQSGTGGALTWTSITQEGAYSVIATQGSLTENMLGLPHVGVSPSPSLYTVSGGGAFCSGGGGVSITLSGSEPSVVTTRYQLKRNGVDVGSPVYCTGTGAAMTWYNQTVGGNYTIVATNAQGCTKQMTGSATVTANPLPDAPVVTSAARWGAGTVTLGASGAPAGSTYEWYDPGNSLLATGASYVTPGISGSIANYLYVKSVSGAGCVSSASTWVSVFIEPLPVITSGSDRVIMGTPVSLDAGEGYASYDWRNGSGMQVGTTRILTTNIAGAYTANVTKAGVPGTGISAPFALRTQFDGMNLNYIISNTILKEGVIQADVDTLSSKSLTQAIQYFDGLGRPMQSVITQGSSNRKDIVQPVAYDAFGREAVKYLPYVSGETNGWYKQDALSQQAAFYNNANDKVADDAAPFAVTVFEPSPLNRIIKQGAPGTAWQPDGTNTYASADHTIKYNYGFNTTSEVLRWTYTSPGTGSPFGKVNTGTPAYYATNQLFKNKTKDEQGHEVIEYVDKQNRVVLKKVQADEGGTEWAQTYYIYNHVGKPVCIIQPEGVKNINDYFTSDDNGKEAFLSKWAFRYRYDGRRREVMKQVPGAEPLYIVYDKRDRVVMSQDGNQRSENKWTFTKYDALNRPIITGIYVHHDSISQAAMSVLISATAFAEHFDNTKPHGYTTDIFPNTNLMVHTVTFYDSYDFRDDLAGSSYNFVNDHLTGQDTGYFNRVKGLVTGTKVNILGSNEYLWSVNYYDDKYRVIQSVTQNHKDSLDRITSIYDFTGKVLKTKITHSISGSAGTSITRSFAYDHAGRLLKATHKTGTGTPVVLTENEYNELGQVVTKNLHKGSGENEFRQQVDYRYNIRGWLTRINNSDLNTLEDGGPSDYFGMELAYNNPFSGVTADAQYNGNISAIKWSTNLGLGFENPTLEITRPKELAYGFSYDKMNRLKGAAHHQRFTSGWDESSAFHEDNIDYDLNGNILYLRRTTENGTVMDLLDYDYGQGTNNYSNKLLSVTDGGDDEQGFIDGNTTGSDYEYDDNGNMTKDKNKDITSIEYNHLNLPKKVTKGTGEHIRYIYDATGRKLSQEVYDTSSVLQKKSDYLGEFFYENDELKFIHHEEGRVVIPPSGGTEGGEYEYHLKDHLGNIRLTFTTKDEVEETIATMETENAPDEESAYLNYAEVHTINHPLFDHTDEGATHNAVRLMGGNSTEKYGLARSLSVMPGDTVRAEVYAKYLDHTTDNWTTALRNIIIALSGSANPGGTYVDGAAQGTIDGSFPYPDVLVRENDNGTGPKAYLNYILFDRNFTFLTGGFRRVTTDAREAGQGADPVNGVPHEHLYFDDIVIREAGYVYIYLSNENETPVEVFFDDFKVEHIKSPIVEAQDYYPGGLTFNSYNRENSTPNQNLYNGKELQDELALNTYDFGWRQYDPAILRWNVVDPLAEKRYWLTPYNFVQNNPINRFDPNGLTDFTLNRKTGAVTQVGEKNDDPDRILRTNNKGEIKYKKNGEAKVAVGGIEQGILKDGQNFKNKDQVISVGGEGQASVAGVKSFTLKLSEYVGKEIKGFSYSSNASGNATDMVLGKYAKNDLTTSFGSVTELVKKYGSNYSSNNILQEFHTHPDGKLGATESAPHLSDDVRTLQSDKPQMPNASFIILYRILGQEAPGEYDYTHQYIPKKK